MVQSAVCPVIQRNFKKQNSTKEKHGITIRWLEFKKNYLFRSDVMNDSIEGIKSCNIAIERCGRSSW